MAWMERHFKNERQACSTSALVPFQSFTGDYVTSTADLLPAAASFIHSLESHQDQLYLVPTYYKALPGAFKNYLDIVQMPSLYQQKRIGIVSTNAKNQDYGARQFLQVLLGLLEFHHAVAVVVPQILILNPDTPDSEQLRDYLNYFASFPVPG